MMTCKHTEAIDGFEDDVYIVLSGFNILFDLINHQKRVNKRVYFLVEFPCVFFEPDDFILDYCILLADNIVGRHKVLNPILMN
jgi:hypothetical protein